MRSRKVLAIGATDRKFRWADLSLAVAALVTLVAVPVTTTVASATTDPSTLCSGYQGCARTFTTHGYQHASDESYWKMYAGDNCTNYVAYVESTRFDVPTPDYNLGNAAQWPMAAAQHGAVVNHVPSVGAVAVWLGDTPGMGASGHVAVVERVGPRDDYIVVSQQHMIVANGFDWVRITRTRGADQWESWPSSFIHFVRPARLVDVEVSLPRLRSAERAR